MLLVQPRPETLSSLPCLVLQVHTNNTPPVPFLAPTVAGQSSVHSSTPRVTFSPRGGRRRQNTAMAGFGGATRESDIRGALASPISNSWRQGGVVAFCALLCRCWSGTGTGADRPETRAAARTSRRFHPDSALSYTTAVKVQFSIFGLEEPMIHRSIHSRKRISRDGMHSRDALCPDDDPHGPHPAARHFLAFSTPDGALLLLADLSWPLTKRTNQTSGTWYLANSPLRFLQPR